MQHKYQVQQLVQEEFLRCTDADVLKMPSASLIRLRKLEGSIHLLSSMSQSAYFSPDQKYIFFVGPKSHIFRRPKITYFSSAPKCIFFAGPKVHIFRRPKTTYFSPAQNHIFFAGPKVHIFRRPKSTYFSLGASARCIRLARCIG
jgi:hypothetical protein